MNLRRKNQEPRVKTSIRCFRLYHISFFFLLSSFISYPQVSIPAAKDLTEEKELNFQHFFFKALSEKSIGNYQKAIENLESCNQILSNNVAVFFEFSKNYFLLNNNLLAKEYINRALIKEANNIWVRKHLVKILVKDKNYTLAITNQKKIIELNQKERRYLVGLYMQNTDYKKADSLLNILEKENGLPRSLKQLKSNLDKRKGTALVEKKTDTLTLIHQFTTDKSYKILDQILKKSLDKPDVLLKYSEEGITLFQHNLLYI
jgi:tetratricopeptide (TPR) repeat protein